MQPLLYVVVLLVCLYFYAYQVFRADPFITDFLLKNY